MELSAPITTRLVLIPKIAVVELKVKNPELQKVKPDQLIEENMPPQSVTLPALTAQRTIF